MAVSIKELTTISSVVFVVMTGMYHTMVNMTTRKLSWRSFLDDAFKDQMEGCELRDSIIQKDYNHVSSLRILTLGTSRTFGATLEDRFSTAYPYQLSRNVTNLAIRATG